MNNEGNPLLFFQIIFIIAFFAILFGGGYVLMNLTKVLGVDPSMPSENSSSRAYSKLQVVLIWAHALLLTGMLSLLMH